jgi:hypothetical protein
VHRPGFEKLLERAGTGASQGIAVWHVDRLFRQPRDLVLGCTAIRLGHFTTTPGRLPAGEEAGLAQDHEVRMEYQTKSSVKPTRKSSTWRRNSGTAALHSGCRVTMSSLPRIIS